MLNFVCFFFAYFLTPTKEFLLFPSQKIYIMFRDFYASRKYQYRPLRVADAPAPPSIGLHAERVNPPFESPRFNRRERTNEGSRHPNTPANTTTTPTTRRDVSKSLVVQNVEKAKSATRYGNDKVVFSASQPRYHDEQMTPQSPPCFHSRDTVEARRKNEEQQRATFLVQQKQKNNNNNNNNNNNDFLLFSPQTQRKAKRMAVAGTQTDENNNNDENVNAEARQSRRLAGLTSQVTLNGKKDDIIDSDGLNISKRITSAVEKSLESIARETSRGMEEIAMRTQRDVLRCAADVARMQRDLSEFMGRYGVNHRSDNDENENDRFRGCSNERETDAKKTTPKKKQKTTPALVSMISDSEIPTDVVVKHILEKASIEELRAANPLLFNGVTSKAKDLRYLRLKISERYIDFVSKRDGGLVSKPPDEKDKKKRKESSIYTSPANQNRTNSTDENEDEDVDEDEDENVELRVREEIAAFQRKTKARTARRRGFAVSTELSIET